MVVFVLLILCFLFFLYFCFFGTFIIGGFIVCRLFFQMFKGFLDVCLCFKGFLRFLDGFIRVFVSFFWGVVLA